MTESLQPFELVFVDVETSGLDPAVHEIISIAAIRVRVCDWAVLREMSCLVQFERPEDEADGAFAVNGYDAERWSKEAISVSHARSWFEEVAGGAGLSSHKRSFEEGFLSAWFPGQRKPWSHRGVCTQALCASLVIAGLTQSNGLAEACGVLGIDLDHHEALSDARASMWIARKLLTPLAELAKAHFG